MPSYNFNFSWLIVLVISFFFCACEKDNEVIINGRANIIGTWNIDVLLEEVRADTLFRTSTFNTEITFFEDGIATSPNPFTGPDPEFTWFYTFDPEFVVINQLVQGNLYNIRECQILENNKDDQLWVYEAKDVNGIVDFWRNTWTMKKRN